MASLQERDRRWKRLHDEMRAVGIDALIVGATDFRGQKGGLRYVTDLLPFHRFGYAVLPLDREPVLVLHPVLSYCPRSDWGGDYRFSPTPGTAMAEVIAALPHCETIGLVQVDQVMRVSDYKALESALPRSNLVSADALFERVRAVKSIEEVAGIEAGAAIADRCFERLLNVARPGLTERDVHAEMLKTCTAHGADEPFFLTMYAEARNGIQTAFINAPSAREIHKSEPFIFSFEMTGPSGHWVELARVVGFEASGRASEIAELCTSSVRVGLAAVRPDGTKGAEIQRALEGPLDPALYEISAWSGHAIGQDVIEMPVIARQGAAPVDDRPIRRGMAFALHPMFHERKNGPLGYVADTYILDATGPRVLSRWPLDFYRV